MVSIAYHDLIADRMRQQPRLVLATRLLTSTKVSTNTIV